ncbi:hypothetical protein GN157_07040 [Flavobacterium rakeshii]|uniref:Uncharacterized protein n=1 Tax=Flavobacterium rakeshii TaxID=1038845 RepID=A0A6N8HC55_9FLAO|nr:hypothetical protein [Flavobacterium rakeshii]MUV03460.1 hypothetical protein [Flavobacterium rakeshii]
MSRITFFKNLKENDINKFQISTVMWEFDNIKDDFTRFKYEDSNKFDFIHERFDMISFGLGKIIRLAEIINYELSTAIFIYSKNKHDIESLCKLSKDCREIFGEKKTFKGFTFAKFAFLMSAILKMDSDFYRITDLNTKEKRKTFTKTLNYFIEDRNYFAHGHLELIGDNLRPHLQVVIENRDYYIKISEELINTYINTFQYLLDIIYNINRVSSNIPLH